MSILPQVVVDSVPRAIAVGFPGTSRIRVVSALPMRTGSMLVPSRVVSDGRFPVGDSDGNVLGTPGVWVARFLAGGSVIDERGLG